MGRTDRKYDGSDPGSGSGCGSGRSQTRAHLSSAFGIVIGSRGFHANARAFAGWVSGSITQFEVHAPKRGGSPEMLIATVGACI